MSRWDALKPNNSRQSRRKPGQQERKVAASPPLSASSLKPSDDNYGEIARFQSVFASLLKSCRLEGPNEYNIESFALFLRSNHSFLPPVSVVNDALGNIFLPVLSKPCLDERNNNQTIKTSSMTLLADLLEDKKLASFVMAPIVESVTLEGKEHRIPNSVRCQLFEALQRQLVDPTSSLEIELPCRVLVKALYAAKCVDGKERHAGQSRTDIETSLLRGFLIQVFSTKQQRKVVAALQLLRAFLERHPDTASSLASYLLLREMGTPRPESSGEPIFLGFVRSTNPEVAHLAVECLGQLLSNLPFQAWLSDHVNHDMRTAVVATRRSCSSTRFQNRFVVALCSILDIVTNWLDRPDFDRCISLSLRSIMGVLLADIPLEQHRILEDVVGALIDKLKSVLLLGNTSQPTSECVRGVLIDASGGRATPEGSIIPMSGSLQRWLLRNPGFVALLVDRIQLSNASSDSEDTCQVLKAILRSCCLFSFCDIKSWSAFSQLVQMWSHSHVEAELLMSSQLIENLFRSRRECSASCNCMATRRDLILFAYPILLGGLTNTGAATRSHSCVAFSCMLQNDWRAIPGGETKLQDCLQRMTTFCLKSSLNAKVRSDVCRAIGDVCNSFLTVASKSNRNEFKSVLSRVCLVFSDLMKDPNSSVRCIALFATGNLAQDLQRADSSAVVNMPHELVILLQQTLDCLDDTDDKVVGNAVRSVGHMACLTFDDRYKWLFESTFFDYSAFCESVLQGLLVRIVRALSVTLASGTGSSWKQRSAAKRQGWGACNSLAALFLAGLAKDERKDKITSIIVACLLDCVTSMLDVHEKVTLSAMGALCCIDTVDLFRLKGRSGKAGETIVACFSWLCKEDRIHSRSPRLIERLESCLVHLLHSVSYADAQFVLESCKLSQEELCKLCNWMSNKQCKVESFASFALALQLTSITVDIEVEQNFCVQAIGQRNEEDDGDEL